MTFNAHPGYLYVEAVRPNERFTLDTYRSLLGQVEMYENRVETIRWKIRQATRAGMVGRETRRLEADLAMWESAAMEAWRNLHWRPEGSVFCRAEGCPCWMTESQAFKTCGYCPDHWATAQSLAPPPDLSFVMPLPAINE